MDDDDDDDGEDDVLLLLLVVVPWARAGMAEAESRTRAAELSLPRPLRGRRLFCVFLMVSTRSLCVCDMKCPFSGETEIGMSSKELRDVNQESGDGQKTVVAIVFATWRLVRNGRVCVCVFMLVCDCTWPIVGRDTSGIYTRSFKNQRLERSGPSDDDDGSRAWACEGRHSGPGVQ